MNNDKYTILISKLEVDDIVTLNIKSFYNNKLSTSKRNKTDIALEHEMQSIDIQGNIVKFEMEFKVIAFASQENPPETIIGIPDEDILFKIDSNFEASYIFSDLDLDEYKEELSYFTENNLIFNIWPYVRELVSSLTVRMGLPALTLPLYKNFGDD